MPITAEQIQIFYEISMSIGTSFDLRKMVKTTLSSYLRKLNCSAGSVLQLIENENNKIEYKEIYSIPRNINSFEKYKNIINTFKHDIKSNKDILKKLPISFSIPGEQSFYIMVLPGFGFLFLATGRKNFDNFIINSIEQLNVKFSESCKACVQNEALEKSEQKYRSIFESIQDAYIEIDANTDMILEISPSIKKIIGFDREELIGRKIETFYIKSKYQQLLNQLLHKQKSIANFEVPMRDKKDHAITVSFSMSLVERSNKNRPKFIGTIRDITKNVQLEQEKNQLEEQYMQAQKLDSIGRLAGGVAHDLNNLLCPVISYGELLLTNNSFNNIHKEQIEQIIQAGLRARDLVQQLLAFSRKQKLEYKSVNLNDVVADFFKLLRRTIREDIKIEIIPTSNIKLVTADVGQIEQVILNLAVNGADAMPKGGRLTIEIGFETLDNNYASVHAGVKPGEYVILAVSDTGCGMDPKVIEHIFESFYSTKGEMGTGLGLATVYGIIKQHGGNILCYSEPNNGSIFKVYLPASSNINQIKIKPEESTIILEGNETILLVEDDELVRKTTFDILKFKGYTVLTSTNGKEALSIFDSHKESIDLILSDLVMPEMNGQELFAKIKKKYPCMKFLFMSGYTDNVITQLKILDEDLAFIQKPFSLTSLAIKIREVLNQ